MAQEVNRIDLDGVYEVVTQVGGAQQVEEGAEQHTSVLCAGLVPCLSLC